VRPNSKKTLAEFKSSLILNDLISGILDFDALNLHCLPVWRVDLDGGIIEDRLRK
jgi:hypothetical protein